MIHLHALDPTEVSFVKRPAIRRRFFTRKSETNKQQPDKNAIAVTRMAPEVMARVQKAIANLPQKVDSAIGDNPQPDDTQASDGLSEQAQRVLQAVARMLEPFKGQITDAHMDSIQEAIGISDGIEGDTDEDVEDAADVGDSSTDDMQPSLVALSEKSPMDMQKPVGVKPKDHENAMGRAKGAYMDHLKGAGYKMKPPGEKPSTAKTDADDPEEEKEEDDEKERDDVKPVKKSLEAFSPEQRAEFEAVFKSQTEKLTAIEEQNKQLVQKNEAASARIQAMEDERAMRGFEEEAKNLSYLGAGTADIASVLKSAKDKLGDEGVEKIRAVLKSANEQVRTAQSLSGNGIFGELGTSLGADAGNTSAEAQLERLVDEYVGKSEYSGKSRAQTYTQVLKTAKGKQLYAQSQAEHDNRLRGH